MIHCPKELILISISFLKEWWLCNQCSFWEFLKQRSWVVVYGFKLFGCHRTFYFNLHQCYLWFWFSRRMRDHNEDGGCLFLVSAQSHSCPGTHLPLWLSLLFAALTTSRQWPPPLQVTFLIFLTCLVWWVFKSMLLAHKGQRSPMWWCDLSVFPELHGAQFIVLVCSSQKKKKRWSTIWKHLTFMF